MTQETLSQIIEAGKPVPITADLMKAAYENALSQRSKALRVGIRWVGSITRAAIVLITRNDQHQTSNN